MITDKADYRVARRRMVDNQLVERGIRDGHVLAAMGKVQRHLFVDPGIQNLAYIDRPLHIGNKQTISQPYMVGLMTQSLGLFGGMKVLEVGTGSGYQTAILAELCREVFTIERFSSLSERAKTILMDMGYKNIHFRVADGSVGWLEAAPFDGIIVTAGYYDIPDVFIEQLADGGRLVIPVGDEQNQRLKVLKKGKERLEIQDICECRFVKLVGRYAWKE